MRNLVRIPSGVFSSHRQAGTALLQLFSCEISRSRLIRNPVVPNELLLLLLLLSCFGFVVMGLEPGASTHPLLPRASCACLSSYRWYKLLLFFLPPSPAHYLRRSRFVLRHQRCLAPMKLQNTAMLHQSTHILLTNSRGDSGKETGEEGEGGRTGQHAGRSEAHHRWEGLRTGTIHR